MTFHEYIINRTNKIAAAQVSRGKNPTGDETLIQIANRWCGSPREYVELKGNFNFNLQRYVLSSKLKDEYQDITFHRNPLIFGIIIHVKSSRQIFVHKSVSAAQ